MIYTKKNKLIVNRRYQRKYIFNLRDSEDNFDSYYGKGETNKSDEIEIALARYGKDNLRQDI